jgi:hypothetical protein
MLSEVERGRDEDGKIAGGQDHILRKERRIGSSSAEPEMQGRNIHSARWREEEITGRHHQS